MNFLLFYKLYESEKASILFLFGHFVHQKNSYLSTCCYSVTLNKSSTSWRKKMNLRVKTKGHILHAYVNNRLIGNSSYQCLLSCKLNLSSNCARTELILYVFFLPIYTLHLVNVKTTNFEDV